MNKERKQLIIIGVSSTLLLIVCLILLIRYTAFNKYDVVGSSMHPTLIGAITEAQTQKEKYKTKKSFDRVYTKNTKMVSRGDIVVIKRPDSERDIIKRVIGIAGDTVELVSGTVRVNGETLNETYLAPGTITRHTIPYAKFVVGSDEIFVLGDNRDNSYDSRSHGCFKRDDISGKCISIVRKGKTIWLK